MILTTIKCITYRTFLKRSFPLVLPRKYFERTFSIYKTERIDFTQVNVSRNIYEDKDLENVYNESEDSISELEEYNEIYQDQDMPNPVRTILFHKPIDYLMTKINNCVSVQEVFDLLKINESYLRPEHIAQSVLVLWDLQKMFYHVNLMNNTLTNQSNIIADLADKYFNQLNQHPDFKLLLYKIEQNCDKYDSNALAVILLYLNKIGMDTKTNLAQLLISKFNEKSSDVSISALSRFTRTVFRYNDLSSYYHVKDFIPTIFNYIENSKTIEEFKHCTICLKNIHRMLSDDTVKRYTGMLRKHIQSGFLDGCEPKTVLMIIMFLNFPEWRDSNIQIITDTIMLVKDKTHLLNSYELLLFYEVFYKIQEPAIILNELQRQASRYLALFEEDAVPLLDVRLRLMLGLVTNCSNSQRMHYIRILKQHSSYDLNRNSIFQFYKLLTYTKVSDLTVTKKLWHSVLHLLDTDEVFRTNNLLKVCMNYLHYTQNINRYRFQNLEKMLNTLLEKEILNTYVMIYPIKFSFVAMYVIVYGQNRKILDIVIDHLEKYKDRWNHIQCLNYTKALNYGKESKNPLLTQEYIRRIQNVIDHAILNNITDDMDININNMLVKSCIFNTDTLRTTSEVVPKLMDKCSENSKFSTRIIKNLAFCMNSTQSLVPKVVDDMVDYIIKAKDNVLGCNVEKVLHLCYQLGYQPKRAQEFFQATTEIILRDQERFTGLSYLHSCLALCYFQSLPNSFIRQIFNTVFLDKLDNELENCYHKDSYPTRVRQLMMQLNRAVCIDYPESNVPWFHQKYINESLRKASIQDQYGITQKMIKSYLNKIIPGNEYLQQNVIAPYGYYIHFVLNLDEEDQFIKSEDITHRTPLKKIALLLLKSNDFTNLERQLLGKTLLKVRHLEILGYNVVLLDVPLWRDMVSGFERVAYLRKLIKVSNSEVSDTRSL